MFIVLREGVLGLNKQQWDLYFAKVARSLDLDYRAGSSFRTLIMVQSAMLIHDPDTNTTAAVVAMVCILTYPLVRVEPQVRHGDT